MKKTLAIVLALLMVVSMFAACGKPQPASPDQPSTPAPQSQAPSSGGDDTPAAPAEVGGKLVVWSFTDEVQKMVDNYLRADLPTIEIEFTMAPSDVYQSKLKPVLQSGQDAPDVFTLESAYVKAYPDTGWLLDLSDLLPQARAANMAQYPIDIMTDSTGKVRGYSWQCTPGAFFYRRSLAKQYLGTDDPAQVQEMVKDVDAFLATAQKLYDGSGGSVKMVTNGDLFNPFKAGRKQGWVVDGKLVIDPNMLDLVDLQKTLKDRKLDNGASPWDASWFACMNDTFKDERGNPVYTFGYFLPTWGLHYVLKTNCEAKDGDKVVSTTAGDWAMVKGPFGYFWGGTWYAAYINTTNPDAAKKLISYCTMDEGFLEKYATAPTDVSGSGDFVSSMNVVNKIKDTFSEPFLGGQNHYATFATMIDSIDGSTMTGYDQEIDSFWQNQMALYINGTKTKDEAIAAFKADVANQFPDVTVD
jgi:multiple sugar transport system substrate-binding protein